MPKPDIFLSYNRTDADRTRQFADALAAEGFKVWWDVSLRSGETYDVVTEAALHEAMAVVVLWSANSVDSRWVRAEATEAERSRKLVPAMIEPCKRPIMFELTQTAELSHWKGDRTDPAWRAFVSDLHGFVGREPRDVPVPDISGFPAGDGPSRGWKLPGRLPLVIIAVLIAIVLGAAMLFWRQGSDQVARTGLPVQIEAFTAEGGPRATLLSQSFRNTVQQVLGEAGLQTMLSEAGPGKLGLGVKGSVIASDGGIKLYIVIEDLESGVALWSRQFEDAQVAAEQLSITAAVAAAESLNNVREVERERGQYFAPDILARFIAGINATANPELFEEGRPRRLFEEIVQRQPESAMGHGMLALALSTESYQVPADEREALIERARSEATLAIRIDPVASGGAYDALYRLSTITNQGDIGAHEKILLEGLANSPNTAFLSMRECELLANVGRIADALTYCRRAIALRPLSLPIGWRMASILAIDRQTGLAEKAIERSAYFYPDAVPIMSMQFDIYAFGNSPDRAGDLLPRMLNRNALLGDEAIAASKDFLRARKSGSKTDADKATSALLAAARNGHANVGFAVKVLALFGKADEAFELLASPQASQVMSYPGTFVLFDPATASLRSDPRFWPLAARLGLIEYWSEQGKWPDFCGRDLAIGECQAAARAARDN